MENYKYVNDRVIEAIEKVFPEGVPVSLLPEDPAPQDEMTKQFCFAKPTKYDVMRGGKKIAGAAQRRKKNGFLHQGSISLAFPSYTLIEKVLLEGKVVVDAMKRHTHYFSSSRQSKNSVRREAS